MKLTAITKINDFIKDIKTNKAILIFGPDNSVVNINLNELVEKFKKNKFEVQNVNIENFKNNPSCLIEDFQAFSMFAKNTLFILKLVDRPNDFTKHLKSFFELKNLNENNFLIITADDLATTSSLRKYSETGENIGTIACYEEDEKNISTYIQKKLKEYNFNFTSDIIAYLSINIGTNKLIINNELEKIALYKNDNNLTLTDVQNCIQNISSFDLSEFINYFTSLKATESFKLLNKAQEENIQNIIIVRSLIKYFLQLQLLKYRIDSGENIDYVIESERVFWKQKATIKTHLTKWSLNNINLMLEKFIELEKTSKFNSNSTELESFLLKVFLKFKF